MASVIDGTTYNGYWTITPDDNSPEIYTQIPKGLEIMTATAVDSVKISFLTDPTFANPVLTTSTTTVDEEGNALNTAVKVSDYFSKKR